MSNNFNSISSLWMYLSLSVNIHQSYRFKMNVKLDISNLNFFPVQTRKKIQLDILNWRVSKNPKIPVQIDRRCGYFAFLSCKTYLLSKEHLMYHHLVGQNIFCRCIRITILLLKYSTSTRNSLETKQWKLERVEWIPFLNFTWLAR